MATETVGTAADALNEELRNAEAALVCLYGGIYAEVEMLCGPTQPAAILGLGCVEREWGLYVRTRASLPKELLNASLQQRICAVGALQKLVELLEVGSGELAIDIEEARTNLAAFTAGLKAKPRYEDNKSPRPHEPKL